VRVKADYFRTLFDYNYWARDRVLAATLFVKPEDYARPNGFTYGSLRGILVHTLSGEWMWRMRWQEGVSPGGHLTEEEVPTLSSLAARWEAEETEMRRFLAELTDARLAEPLTYTRPAGDAYSQPLWQAMAHVANHSTHHRAEAAEALTMLGYSPGDIDMIRFFREGNG
jgi:uncharacterized damage-inducible protein DinB